MCIISGRQQAIFSKSEGSQGPETGQEGCFESLLETRREKHDVACKRHEPPWVALDPMSNSAGNQRSGIRKLKLFYYFYWWILRTDTNSEWLENSEISLCITPKFCTETDAKLKLEEGIWWYQNSMAIVGNFRYFFYFAPQPLILGREFHEMLVSSNRDHYE